MGILEEKSSFIFDLYGTLVDICTDEENQKLWIWLAKKYDIIGCDHSASGIKREYRKLVKVKEHQLGLKAQTVYPEIELRQVFRELMYMRRLDGKGPADFANIEETNKIENRNMEKWVEEVAIEFRQRSRMHFQLFEDTIPVLTKLREMGKQIYLLSNAQNCFTVPEMKELKLDYYFDEIYISSDCGVKKPDPGFMGRLLREQGLQPKDCVMIGNDFDTDVGSAAYYDMDAVFLNADGYGYADMHKRLHRVKDRYKKNIKPYMIVSGRLLELLEL